MCLTFFVPQIRFINRQLSESTPLLLVIFLEYKMQKGHIPKNVPFLSIVLVECI